MTYNSMRNFNTMRRIIGSVPTTRSLIGIIYFFTQSKSLLSHHAPNCINYVSIIHALTHGKFHKAET